MKRAPVFGTDMHFFPRAKKHPKKINDKMKNYKMMK
jgi:hypothetical protein